MQFDLNSLEDAKVYDPQGEKIGKVDDVFYDEQTGQPEWLLVNTGIFSRDTMIPLVGSDLKYTEDGLSVSFSKDQVKNAPDMDVDQDRLDESQERELYDYYGVPYGTERSDTQLPEGGSGQGTTGLRGGEGTQEMTRSEEVLGYRKVRRPSETVRLRKRVVTENVQQTVPVEREEVVEHVPVGEGEGRSDIGEDTREITLSEEEVIPEKHVEAKAKLRVDKRTVSDEERLSEDLRKERIDVERDDEHRAA